MIGLERLMFFVVATCAIFLLLIAQAWLMSSPPHWQILLALSAGTAGLLVVIDGIFQRLG